MSKKLLLRMAFITVALIFLGISFYNEKSLLAPVLSHKSGFYDKDFYLEIDVPPNAAVHYTLDGSIPDENSPVYTGPLLITNASSNPNVYSAIENISVYEVVYSPDFPVDKCNVIRAVSVNAAGLHSKVVNATYFVGISPEDYPGCGILSLITDPSNLFDHNKGIYVLGAIFDEYVKTGDTERYPFYWSANYNQRGMEWEREAVFHFFGSDSSLVLEKNGGVRIRGGTTRAWGKKGFNLFARPEYDGTEHFSGDFFGNGYMPQAVSLMTGGNQPVIQFLDYAANSLMQPLNIVTAAYKPYVLFLNGEYWGFYWMAEKFDDEFFGCHYNVDSDNVVMIKNKTVEVGEDKDILLYSEMMDFIENSDMSVAANYALACQMIDVDSCLDYYASLIYIARANDWPHYNVALWRTRSSDGGGYCDGKWRWVLFDCNSASMGVPDSYSADHNTLEFALEKSDFFRSLWASPDFRKAFEERILLISETVFEGQKMSDFTDDFSDRMFPVLSGNWDRFYTLENDKDAEFIRKMTDIKTFFAQRKSYVEKWFE